MKPQLTFVFLLLCFGLQAQVKFKVKLLPDNTTYQVIFKSDATWAPPLNATSSSQVTLRVPTGGFTVGTVTSLAGTWSHTSTVVAPSENPGYDYINFGLQGATNEITYEEGMEVAVFNFANSGTCTGAVELLENDTDPFMPPNSQSVNVGNAVSVIGAGIGQNAYLGNFGAISADCTPSSSCGIEIFDIILTSPSACGVADGSIEIEATNSGGLPLQYSIDDGVNFQSDPVFSGLAAGDEFEIIVRDIAAICIVEVGVFELDGPLAAIVTGVDVVDPDCGMDNGSITIHAIPQNGGQLEYGIGTPPVWQTSNEFTGLATGTYSFWVMDIVNNCQNFVGNYTLDDCQTPSCILTYDLEHIGNGIYQVSLLSDTTWNFPNNITSSLMVTIKVPTGGFVFDNLTSQIAGVNFGIGSTYTAPPEDPAHDYITVNLNSPGTQDIQYIQGLSQPLFTFENTGTCMSDSLFLMAEDDPFFPPNSQNANVSQQIFVSGAGTDIQVCLGQNSAVCEAPPESCLITYELEKTSGNTFQVSMIPDVTWTMPMNITSSLQVTIKVPTGGFEVGNLTSLVSGVNWSEGSMYTAPPEDPNYDYISILLASPGTQGISYTQGVKLPLFSFENIGTCQGSDILLMDNDNDPFFPPNSQNANVGQQLFTAGSGQDVQACVLNQPADDCNDDPCAQLSVGFTAPDGCEGQAVDFTNTTTSPETITSWNWTFGDNESSAEENPSHTFSTSGNFEVSLTVTTESGCEATFSEFVTVFPSPGAPTVTEYIVCDGVGVTLDAPAADMVSWSPATDLDDPTSPTPVASPTATTVYTVTLTSADGCQTMTDVTVIAAQKPVFKEMIATPATDCGVQDASIFISGQGEGALEYSIDNGDTWSTDSLFTDLPAGDYIIMIRNAAGGTCPVAFNGNPVTISDLVPPSIDDVTTVDPTGCNPDGSITVIASGGNGPLLYSLTGQASVAPQNDNTFAGLMEGDYSVIVTNADGTCQQTQNVTLTGTGPNLAIVTSGADQDLCVSASAAIAIELNMDIASFNISGGSFSNENTSGSMLTFDVTASLGANNFNVELTGANGCVINDNFTVTGVAEPSASFSTSPTLCTNGEITLNYTGTGNGTLSWTLDGGQQNFASQDNSTVVVEYATSGSKQICVTIDADGCQSTDCQTLSVTEFDPGATFAITQPDCGASNGAIDLNVTGGGTYSYQWSGPGAAVNSQNQTDLPGGSYLVTITEDGSGCETQMQAELNIPTGFTVFTTANDAADCDSGAGTGSIDVTLTGATNNGIDVFTYQLFEAGSLDTPLETETSVQTSITFEDLPAGAYTVEVNDINGCNDQSNAAIQSASADLAANFTPQNAGCGLMDGSVAVEITAGAGNYQYDFFLDNELQANDVPVAGNTFEIANIAAGNAVLIITDDNNCLLPVMFTIANDASGWPLAASASDATCGSNDGSIDLTGAPTDALITWADQNGVPVNGGLGASITDLAPGVYTATIIDPNTTCTEFFDVTIGAADGAEIQITDMVDASCGNADGSLTFMVNGGGGFSWDILGSSVGGSFGNPGAPVTVNGLEPGAYVIEITDLSNGDCQSFESAVIGGSLPSGQVVAVTTPVSECGVSDAEICITISGGSGPYTLTSDLGTFPSGQFLTEACITDLYDGMVNLTISDGSGECDTELAIELPEVPNPTIDDSSVSVSNLTCPDDMGSIMSTTGDVFEIFDEFNTKVGETPWMAATPGTYMVRFAEGICTAEMEVEVTGPAPWEVDVTVTPETCDENDGMIELSVNGGSGDYGFEWSNSPQTTEMLTGLSAGFYDVTITDSEGCTTVEEQIIVDYDCATSNPCDGIFVVDTFLVMLQGDRTEICLPTEYADMTIFDLELNNSTYADILEVCTDSTIFYGYGMLLNLGNPPYNLEEWTYRGSRVSDFQFEEMGQLVDYMNDLDPFGNWSLDMTESSISGGAPNSSYGSLILSHVGSATTLNLQVNTVSVDHPSIFVNDDPVHVFVAQDPTNPGCADTLYINLQSDTPDSIYVTVNVGETEEVCLPLGGLSGAPEFLNNVCQSVTNNAQLITTADDCIGGLEIGVNGLSEGSDLFCMEICDANGVCNTVYVVIEVIDDNEFEIFNAFSPNEDGQNDYFRVKGIEQFPNNSLIVFNRWGNRVYQQEGYTNLDPWRAMYKNTHLSDGTYFYILDVEMNGKMETFSGYVEIRR